MPDQISQLKAMLSHLNSDESLDLRERERRVRIISDIIIRLQDNGEHVAKAHPDRARQFMPFAALKGYHELARERERVPEPKHTITEELVTMLSETIASLSKGDTITIKHYENDRYTTTCGLVTEVDETFRTIRIVKKDIAFNDILSIKVTS